MTAPSPSIPESCSQCLHVDQFHSTCSHPLRQTIIRELTDRETGCPLFPQMRSEAMRDLEDSIERGRTGE